MKRETPAQKVERFEHALNLFIDRLKEDRYVLAAVQLGSINEEIIWSREHLSMWLIEADGVTRRLKSDGNKERIFRTFVEEGINIHVELIPRSRFKRMIEGSSRTAFSHNFFETRTLIYTDDPSIESWFNEANELAKKDQENELLATTTWTIYAHRMATKYLDLRDDLQLATEEVISAAHSLSALEIIRSGQICENDCLYKAIDLNPELFQVVYLDVIKKRKSKKLVRTALDRIAQYLEEHAEEHLKPLLRYLRKQQRMVPLSEIAEYFAHSQLYPWHLEYTCEWLERKGRLEKVSAPFKVTTKSRVEVEEPAYFIEELS